MNQAYEFGGLHERAVEMARLQIHFLEDDQMVGSCLQNLLAALQANPGNAELRAMLSEELPRLRGCLEGDSESVGELAAVLLRTIESG
jgi:hypothetical protein